MSRRVGFQGLGTPGKEGGKDHRWRTEGGGAFSQPGHVTAGSHGGSRPREAGRGTGLFRCCVVVPAAGVSDHLGGRAPPPTFTAL